MDPINQQGSPDSEEALNHEQVLSEPGDNSLLSLYDLSLSPGYRFAPNDHELIEFYLKKKINIGIRSANVYQYSPLDLTELYPSLEHNEWYFFTPRNQMDLFWKQPNRVAGNGYWKSCGTEKQIYHNTICIGSKKSLIFYQGMPMPPKGKQTNWVMEEYAVDNNNLLDDDFVLCRIHQKKKLHPSSRNKKQKTNKCVEIEHQGTSLQNNSPVPKSNHPMLRDDLVTDITTVPAQDTNIVTSH